MYSTIRARIPAFILDSFRAARLASVILVIAAALAVAGCGGGSGAAPSSGAATQNKRVKAAKAPFSRLRVAPAHLGFPRIKYGKTPPTEARNFAVRNTGTAPLTVTIGGANAPQFTVTQGVGQAVLPPGGSMVVSVMFAPYADGAFSGGIPITSDATKGRNAVTVVLRGSARGTPPPAPTPTPTPVSPPPTSTPTPVGTPTPTPGGTPTPVPSATPTPTAGISGTAIQGPMQGSTITAFAVNPDGSNGAQLGTTTSGLDGSFDLSVPPQSGPVRVTASGGSFVSEMTGATITPSPVSILLASVNATNPPVSINPLSTFIDQRTVALIKGGTALAAALPQATNEIEKIYGLTSDPGTYNPDYTTANEGTDPDNLGLILGAIINEDQALCPAAPGGLVSALAADISDGIFDGLNAGTAIQYCNGGTLPAIAGTSDFQDALSGLQQLQLVTQAFAFGGTNNILTINGVANIATGGPTAYQVPPLVTIDQAIFAAAPPPTNGVGQFAAANATAHLNTARYDAASAMLQNGNFLIAGGSNGANPFLTSIEIYNPATNAFTVSKASLSTSRANETATLLPNGEVLIAGGAVDTNNTATSWTASTDLYNPANDSITAGPPMTVPREGASAVLLPNGLVLIAGGRDMTGVSNEADLFNPANGGSITAIASLMSSPRYDCAAVLLPNGNVFIAGGYSSIGPTGQGQSHPVASTDIYNITNNTFTPGPALTVPRGATRATLLPDGTVLVAGGDTGVAPGVTSTADICNITTNTCTAVNGAMSSPRRFQSQVLLPNGKVLIAGGFPTDSIGNSSTDLYDPVAVTFTPGPSMNDQRGLASIALLPNGKVLIAGGISDTPGQGIHTTTDLYTP
jgi:hypothetical protein